MLSNIQQYYVGKRRAKEIRDKCNANDPENDTNSIMEDNENEANDGDLDISSKNHPINSNLQELDSRNVMKFTADISANAVCKIVENTISKLHCKRNQLYNIDTETLFSGTVMKN